MAAFIFVFAAGAYAGITSSRESETLHPPVTEDNSPVNMFLQLDENITLEQVMAQEDERDWYFSTTSESNEFQKRVGTTVKGIDIRPAWSEESGQQNDRSYLYYEQSDGELLELYFAVEEDNSSWLVYARLVIKTDDGVASCYYYPTDITKWGGETGFNLSVKGAGQLFQRKYLLETAQEVMDIVYPLVYPNGY
ncbi:MAG: hypothetical protein LUC89_05385 [Oscillospiraceae bacterium]|nr:hypothetical protein [Oscillospiraceae bacterium]